MKRSTKRSSGRPAQKFAGPRRRRAETNLRVSAPQSHLSFIDLFAGIGGFRQAFERFQLRCVFSSEWDRFARRTYVANFGDEPAGDIRAIPAEALPPFDILTAGFPCQAFSIAGVSKKNALGRAHGFLDETQGTLFFEVARILRDRRPLAFLLENVKNLVFHDGGRTFEVIRRSLADELGYHVDYRIINAAHVLPQNRERIFIVGFREKAPAQVFKFPDFKGLPTPRMGDILENNVDARYYLSDRLWKYLQEYREKHRQAGHGFGFGLVDADSIARTLSARYYKDGSEILIQDDPSRNPRRLTPRECARLMGFPDSFKIPVSDTQAYKQFGNSVAVPVATAVAASMLAALAQAGLADSGLLPQAAVRSSAGDKAAKPAAKGGRKIA